MWTPNLRGVIETEDGAEILLSVHGQSVEERTTAGARRAILARLELLTEHERYRWLNTSFVAGEGDIDEESEEWWIHTYVCVNEVAEGPTAIGETLPEPSVLLRNRDSRHRGPLRRPTGRGVQNARAELVLPGAA